jgi:hypothetical protein
VLGLLFLLRDYNNPVKSLLNVGRCTLILARLSPLKLGSNRAEITANLVRKVKSFLGPTVSIVARG